MSLPRPFPLFSSLLLAASLASLTSCGSLETAAPPVASFATPAQHSYSNLVAGRALYVGRCAKCHSAEPVKAHSLTDWKNDIMPEMAKKAKLSPAEESDVMAYITAASQIPATPKS